ncbi:hypothetical protein FKM82_014788 [Ascaphus truei]
MSYLLCIVNLTCFWIVLVAGGLGNLFVLVWNLKEQRSSIHLATYHLLIISITFSNLLTIIISVINSFIATFSSNIFVACEKFMWVTRLACLCCSLWFSTWLCVYYCLKIVTGTSVFYNRMKVRFPRMVPWLILSSVMLSTTISVSQVWFIMKNSLNSTANVSATDTTYVAAEYLYSFSLLSYTLVSSLDFLINSMAALTILISLYRHVKRVKLNAGTFRSPKLEAHYGAAKTVTSNLILYIIYFFAQISNIFSHDENRDLISSIAIYVSISLIPVILVLGNPRMTKLLRVGFQQCFTKRDGNHANRKDL